MTGTPDPAALPRFDVRLAPPDLAPWIPGNTGIPGITTLHGPEPGPHVLVTALMHGNEIAGAIVLDRLLRAPPSLRRGRLTLAFLHLDAYARFDPAHPTASRFIEEDLNRVWDPAVLDGPRNSQELARARAVRPIVATADTLLDLHSMLWPSEPLILSGIGAAGRRLGLALGTPSLVVADRGHQTGPRLIDDPRFTASGPGAPAAVLVEAGQHWQPETVDVMQASLDAVLRHTALLDTPDRAPRQTLGRPPRCPPRCAPRCAEVTMAVTATTPGFAFVQPFRGGDVIPRRNTLIALDGTTEIRTPHDDCLLVMPSLRASRGHTAVRLARFVDPESPTCP